MSQILDHTKMHRRPSVQHAMFHYSIRIHGKRRYTAYLDGAGIGLDVYDIANDNFFLQDGFVDARIKTKLFCALHGF